MATISYEPVGGANFVYLNFDSLDYTVVVPAAGYDSTDVEEQMLLDGAVTYVRRKA